MKSKHPEQLNLDHTGMEDSTQAFGKSERYVITCFFVLMLLLRIAYACRFRFHADEPQHLHVVWAWTNGLLQYGDVFDNHGPLFHALCAPILGALGERPDILILMRLTMIPFSVISLLCVFKIGKAIGSIRSGMWAAVFTGLFPRFFLTSIEFRSDALWTVLWLLAVLTVVQGAFTKKRAFLAGLILGMAFSVTVKSGLLVGAMIFGALCIHVHRWIAREKVSLRSLFNGVCQAASGFLIAPLCWILYFFSQGSLKQLFYCNVTHNLVPHAQQWERLDAHVLWFPVFAGLSLVALIYLKERNFGFLGRRRMFLVFTTGAYYTALKSFFPTLSRQDDMPFIPLACICLALLACYLTATGTVRFRYRWLIMLAFPTMASMEVAFILISEPLSNDGTSEQIATLGSILRATRVEDYVMDPSGEAIFRRRPFYYALETFTAVRIERGLLPDTIVQDMIRTQTGAVLPHGLTKIAKDFTRNNYLDVGNNVSILGRRLETSNPGLKQTSISFDIVVPNRYVILQNGHPLETGTLDGASLSGPRFLGAGKHTFQNDAKDSSGICVFWSVGFERGFTPLEKGASGR